MTTTDWTHAEQLHLREPSRSAEPTRAGGIDPRLVNGMRRKAVLIISPSSDPRAGAAVGAAVTGLSDRLDPSEFTVHGVRLTSGDIGERLARAAQVYVLDPGTLRCLLARRIAARTGRPHPLMAGVGVVDRIATIDLLSRHRRPARWVSSLRQLWLPAPDHSAP